MLPIILKPSILNVLVIGKGRATDKRMELLAQSGVTNITHIENPAITNYNITDYNLVYVGDIEFTQAEKIAVEARINKIFINVEDTKPLCDFHVPAIHRSGNLLLTSSTNGTAPRLARKVKQVLEKMFDAEFAAKTKILESERMKLMEAKASFDELIEKSDIMIEKTGIFKKFCEKCRF
ncbi:MAG TPA: hypothetical protein DIV86_01255 [Alphaproteobacteria bacterium]|nr:hypothetical protein [Alphaproteobacteria bacterium]